MQVKHDAGRDDEDKPLSFTEVVAKFVRLERSNESQAQFAKRIGLHQHRVSDLESQKKVEGLKLVDELIVGLGMDVHSLLKRLTDTADQMKDKDFRFRRLGRARMQQARDEVYLPEGILEQLTALLEQVQSSQRARRSRGKKRDA
jgi:transcriptional regulator with XRE-family HTH domain